MTSFTYSGDVPPDTETLTISETVQALPEGFCSGNHHLQQVIFSSSSGIQAIVDLAFSDCKALRDFAIPSTVKAIGISAFAGCASLTEISLPEGLETLGSNSFTWCGFTHLRIPGSLEVIEKGAFEECLSLRNVELFYGLKVIGEAAFAGCSSLQEARLPATIELIRKRAFRDCHDLEAVDLPEGLREIGEFAFANTRSLRSVAIPSSVKIIDFDTFLESGLQVLRLEPGLEAIRADAFRACCLERVSIPCTVSIIGDNAFDSCSSLRDVKLADGSLERIGDNAFKSCTSLLSIWIPPSVNFVGDLAFNDTGLISVEIPPDSFILFRSYVFNRSSMLANIAFTPSCHTIREGLFNYCNCRALEIAYGSANVLQGIKSRFHGYPVHEACYYASSTESDAMLIRALRTQAESNDNVCEHLIDRLGMTPFHVLMSAAKKRPDLLKLLLEAYPSNVLACTCPNGNTALDYLVMNWTMESSIMLRMALDKWMIGDMENWGIQQWRSRMSELVECIFDDDPDMSIPLEIINHREITLRTVALEEACNQRSLCELMEATSLLEMWSWKMKMQSMRNDGKRMAVDRESNRARCGAAVVVPSVVEYLQGGENW
ncbi:MAG: hypothetical protein SGBAC_010861 [Bacillariaceae sp.]